jgi:ureidoacrylate peracid hydrolase
MGADPDDPPVRALRGTTTSLGATPRSAWRVDGTSCDLRRPAAHDRAGWSFDAEPQHLLVDPLRCALVVIDMQNDFCHPRGGLASIGVDVEAARRPIEPLVRLLAAWRASDTPVLWCNWGNRPDRANLPPGVLHVYNPDGRGHGIGDDLPGAGPVLEAGSWGAALLDELRPEPGDITVDKYRMSGFWDTPLDSILRNLDVTTLFFAGVNVDQCVFLTLADAACIGYDCILVSDCSGTTSPGYCEKATMYNIRQCFGFTVTSDAVIGGMA